MMDFRIAWSMFCDWFKNMFTPIDYTNAREVYNKTSEEYRSQDR